MMEGIDHVNIVVSNLDRSVDFYTRVLGLAETRRAHLEGDWIEAVVGLSGVVADVVYLEPPEGGLRVELLQYCSPEGTTSAECSLANTIGLRHVAFRVGDIEGVAAKLVEAGFPPLSPPTLVPQKVITHDAGHKVLCYFHDPDGVLLELAEYR
jgi:glyoxylase I family protein